MTQQMVDVITIVDPEKTKDAVLEAYGNPNKVPHMYVLLMTSEKDTWFTFAYSREELRRKVIDMFKAAEDTKDNIDVEASYVIAQGYELNCDEELPTLYRVMKHIEQFFVDDDDYEAFDIEDYC